MYLKIFQRFYQFLKKKGFNAEKEINIAKAKNDKNRNDISFAEKTYKVRKEFSNLRACSLVIERVKIIVTANNANDKSVLKTALLADNIVVLEKKNIEAAVKLVKGNDPVDGDREAFFLGLLSGHYSERLFEEILHALR